MSNFFIYKNKLNATYIQTFKKKINVSFRFSYSNIFRLKRKLDSFKFQKIKKERYLSVL